MSAGAPGSSGPSEPPGLDVVVVAYGPPDLLAGALEALGRSEHALVVDNSSSVATKAVARAAGADYVDAGANLGFAAAVNLGLEHRRHPGGDVLLLNPDARIDGAALAGLRRELAERQDVACVAPALRAAGSGAPGRGRWPWHTPAGAWAEAAGLARHRLRSERYFLGGAVLLLRGAALAEVGPFDERFFLYGEDEDWQRRALRRGWRVRYCPEIRAEHGAGGTDRDAERHRLRLHASTERYVRKWYGTLGWAVFRSGTLAGLVVRLVVRRGARRRASATLARLYLTGPDRAARRAGAVPERAGAGTPVAGRPSPAGATTGRATDRPSTGPSSGATGG